MKSVLGLLCFGWFLGVCQGSKASTAEVYYDSVRQPHITHAEPSADGTKLECLKLADVEAQLQAAHGAALGALLQQQQNSKNDLDTCLSQEAALTAALVQVQEKTSTADAQLSELQAEKAAADDTIARLLAEIKLVKEKLLAEVSAGTATMVDKMEPHAEAAFQRVSAAVPGAENPNPIDSAEAVHEVYTQVTQLQYQLHQMKVKVHAHIDGLIESSTGQVDLSDVIAQLQESVDSREDEEQTRNTA